MTNFNESLQTLNDFTNTLLSIKQTGGRVSDSGNLQFSLMQPNQDLSEEGTGIITGPNSQGAKVLDTINGVAKTAVGAIDRIVPPGLTEGIADKSWDEVAPNIINNIEGPAKLANDALRDPEVRAALKNALELYAEALGKALDIAEPEINEILEKFAGLFTDASEKGARGFTTAMIDTGLAMIEAIPGGQVVGLIAAMGYWFNAVVASTVIPAIKGNAVFLSDGFKMIKNTKSRVIDKYGPKLREAQQQLTNAVQNAKSKASQMSAQAKDAASQMSAQAKDVAGQISAQAKDAAGQMSAKANAAASQMSAKANAAASQMSELKASKTAAMSQLPEYSSKGGYAAYGGSKKKRKNAARTMRRLKRTLSHFQKPNRRTRKK